MKIVTFGEIMLRLSAAAGAFKHSIKGDCGLFTVDELEALVLSERTGRVQR